MSRANKLVHHLTLEAGINVEQVIVSSPIVLYTYSQLRPYGGNIETFVRRGGTINVQREKSCVALQKREGNTM